MGRLACLILMGLLAAQGTTVEEDAPEELLWELDSRTVSPDTGAQAREGGQNPLADDTLYERPLPPPPLRLIDSPRSPRLTLDPKVNKRIRTTRPFKVQIVRPKLQNNKGYPLPYGFDTYYLYIVRAEEVRIEGKVMRTNGLPIYLAITSPAKTLPDELPTVLESPALMLKGIIDYGDTIVNFFKNEKSRLEKDLDSLRKLAPPPDEYQAERFQEYLQKTEDSLHYAEVHYELYRAFKNAKKSGQGLIQFFLSYPFNRDFMHSIYARPYALPEYHPPTSEAPPKKNTQKSR